MDLASEARPSMDKYGRELADAINRYSSKFWASTVTPPDPRVPTHVPAHTAAAKVVRYYARYCSYPLVASRNSAAIHHIVDHSYGHLVHVLNRHRTIATCHDLMLLRLAD